MSPSDPVAHLPPVFAPADPRDERIGMSCSRAAVAIGIALLAATFLLFSPPRGETYPGAVPWGDRSVLRVLTEVLSLQGWVSTARGTEIKDFALHLAAALGLLLLGLRWGLAGAEPARAWRLTDRATAAQVLLIAWVVISGLSAFWSGDPALARGQAVLYGLALAWAIALAWTVSVRHVPHLLMGLVGASTAGAILCIWYYYERNPFHRPGFPLGNPGTLAAAVMPAILICLCVLVGAAARWRRERRLPGILVAGSAAALLPLLWCFALTSARGAALGLAVGLATILFVQFGSRTRWVIAIVTACALSLGGTWLLSQARWDAAMARGATIRFRLYTWRYAAELWNESWLSAVAGHGAGAYPRLAGQLSLRDRELDPTAFMGEIVEHAHNELFEVLSEIGLVGGVTFVGGILATLAAGGALLRQCRSRADRWLYTGLLAGLLALLTDALFSPGLRLPGVPAVFYTVVGALWAAGRRPLDQLADLLLPHLLPTSARARQLAAAAVAVLLAIGAGRAALRNWSGVIREASATFALRQGQYEQALRDFELARSRLLDPVRQLIASGLAAQASFNLADQATTAWRNAQPAGAPAAASQDGSEPNDAAVEQLRSRAVARCTAALQAAADLNHRAPTLMYSAGIAASAAELLSELTEESDPDASADWRRQAWLAWIQQRAWRRYDIETLLALTRYPGPLNDHLRLLRDALRATPGFTARGLFLSFDDIRSLWLDALRRLAAHERFPDTLRRFLAAVGPADPDTDLDSLIASHAPEIYRLAGHYAALQADFETAGRFAARAASLYQPMRPRFPLLYSVALLEQAEFTLRGTPEHSQPAVDLLRRAIEALPVIQEQKYEVVVWPFRRCLAAALLVADAEEKAKQVIREALGDESRASRALAEECVRLALLDMRQPTEQRPPVDTWLRAALTQQPDHLLAWGWRAWLAAERADLRAVEQILADAAAAGLTSADIQRIRRSLCQEFPALCDGLQRQP